MRFLILTEPDDVHAIVVKLALERDDHHVTLMFTADQPTQLKNSIYFEQDSWHWRSENIDERLIEDDYDVVWWRRARQPYIPRAVVHPDDYAFVHRENKLFFESFTHTIAPHAWWINPKEAAARSHHKAYQLRLAQECGLSIPVTLCSNDPEEVRYFLLAHESTGVIYKTLSPHFWMESDAIRMTYTSKIGFLDLPDHATLQRVPGLFQKEIKKAYELRVTCFGRRLVAAKLDSQVHDDGLVDWRAIRKRRLSVEPYVLPCNIEEKIKLLMYRLGIVFGAMDFIVTPEGEYVFLEVNEQGQFLWVEEHAPHIPMLHYFIEFLTHQSSHETMLFEPRHTVREYWDAVEPIFVENRKRHVDLNQISMSSSLP